MVRTKGNVNAVKISGAKAPRKYSSPSSRNSSIDFSSAGGSRKDKLVGGNSACARPTPDWQKPIGSFFIPVTRPPMQDSEKNDNPISNEPNTNAITTNCDDNKENENPAQNSPSTSAKNDLIDDMPGPSSRQPRKSSGKKRRVLMIESDSEEEEAPRKTLGCFADVEDEIAAS